MLSDDARIAVESEVLAIPAQPGQAALGEEC